MNICIVQFLHQLRIEVFLFKLCSSLRLFLNCFVWPRIPLKSSCVRAKNSLISCRSFSHATKWFSTAFLSSSTVFKSFSGSLPPSNFFTASINSRDLLLRSGAGFDPEVFLTGIWELFLVVAIGIPLGLPVGLESLVVGDAGSFRDWVKKLMTSATLQSL